MGVYIYCIRENYEYCSRVRGREFDNEWLSLSVEGKVVVKGRHYKGYAWDGCSPKLKIRDIYFGTSEAVLNPDTGQSKTYYASLIHDIFYQFSRELRSQVSRKEVDSEFYRILKRDKFVFARLYYYAVRLIGWVFWYR